VSTINPQLYALAAAVLRRWEEEVRRFAPDEHLRWQQLLQQLPEHCTAQQLRDALAPLIAKNRQEQDLFYTFFEAESAEIPEEKPQIQAPTNGFWARYAPLLLLAGLGALIAGMYFLPPHPAALPATPLRLYLTVAAGAAKEVCPDSTTLLQMGPIQRARFTETDADTLRRPVGRLALSMAGCITLQANPDSAGTDSVRYQLQSARGSRAVDVIIDVVQVSGTDSTVLTKPASPAADTLLPYPMPYNHDPLVRAMELGNAGFWVKYAWVWKLGAWLLFAGLLVCFLWWRAWRRKKYVARRNENARPPYVWNIRIPGMAPPDPGDAFQGTLQALRRRTEDEARVPDLPASVRAAARKAGLATLLYKKLSRPSEYLLLVDRHDHRDHRARLYDDLYRTLRNNEVLVERFFFENDLRLCFNEAHPEGIGIEELLFRYPQHRLLVVSAGRGLFSGSTGRLMKWTETLERWKQRALLSPLPPGQWRRREDQLARLFQFAPATMLGLGRVITAFETDDADTGAPDLTKMAALGGGDTIQLDAEGDLLQTLRAALPDATTRNWLACCALWPELHYDLTLWIGNWLEQESGVPVTSFERLNELLRLPWFSQGAMPDAVRVLLLNELRATEPTLEPRLRNALHQLLREQGPPTDSAAWDDFALRIAFNEWMIATDPKLKKALAERIAQYIDATGRTDFIMVQELKGPPGPLDNLLPDNLKKRFFKGGIPAIGLRDLWKDRIWALVALLCAGLALVFWPVEAPVCNGLEADIRLDEGETVHCCIETEAQNVLLLEYNYRDAAHLRDTTKLGVLTRAANSGKGWPQGLTSDTSNLILESRANIANALYHAGLPFYRIADSLRRVQPGFRPDTSIAKQMACRWFEQAAVWDNTPSWVRAANAWCAAPDKPIDIPDNDPNCRRVANVQNGLGFRTKSLTQANYALLELNGDIVLEQGTLIQNIKPGATVSLLDSTLTAWKIQYNGRIGYVARKYRGNPTLISCEQTGAGGGSAVVVPGVRRNYALLFAVDDYKSGNFKLRYSIEQTMALANELRSEYGFDTRVIQNPTKSQILSAVKDYQNRIYTDKDQLLIYFSGAGYFEDGGYLAPSDGNNRSAGGNNIKYTDFQAQINAIRCPSILLALDASMGAVLQKSAAAIGTIKQPARQLIAAGFQERVPDKSPFAERFLETLQNLPQSEVMNTDRLLFDLKNIKPAVFYSEFGNHAPGASFYFVKTQAAANNPSIPLPDLVPIPGGSYRRGCADEKDPDCSDDEKPVREVKINAFSIGRTEVTNAQYCAFLNAMGNREDGGVTWIDLEGKYEDERCRIKQKGKIFTVENGYEQYPVIYVSWYGAKAYCDWLSSKVKDRKYRLPTEAEWEYAALGGNKPGGYKYAGSDDLEAVGWYEANSDNKVHPVGQKKGNVLGLMDMSGNLWEWCNDWYGEDYYASSPTDNPQGPETGSDRVRRGGSWLTSPRGCRVSFRNFTYPDFRDDALGFRVAASSQ